MNEPRTSALALWNRLISGETLDEDDLQQLIDFVQLDSALRKEIEADASLHALLRSVTEVQNAEDQFVQSVLERCRSLDHDVLPQEEKNRVEQEVIPTPVAEHLIVEAPEATSVNGTSTPRTAGRFGSRTGACQKRRQPSAWTATTLSAVVFACLGLVVWTQFGPPSSQPGSNSTEGVVQGTTREQSGRSETESTTDYPVFSPAEDSITASPSMSASANEIQPDQNDNQLPEPTLVGTPQMRPEIQGEGIANRPDPESQSQFVTLTKIQDPVWERESVVGDRLGEEIVRLFAGTAELTFDKGAVVTVDGPVEFRPMSTGKLELKRGRILARVPRKAIGFIVSTPTSNVVDFGTEFEVTVNDQGESNVQVLKGEVEVASISPNGEEFQKWRLIPNKFDRASFFACPRLQGPTPISTSLRGPRDQFQGFVSIDGQTAEFSSPEAFENVRNRAEIELARSQENALKQWKEFVNSMQKNMQGSMNLNGQEMQFRNLQDVMRLQNRMLENLQNAKGNSGESSFQGSFNVNGKIINFKTRKEYEAARRAAFGPAATFGIGDVLEGHSGSR